MFSTTPAGLNVLLSLNSTPPELFLPTLIVHGLRPMATVLKLLQSYKLISFNASVHGFTKRNRNFCIKEKRIKLVSGDTYSAQEIGVLLLEPHREIGNIDVHSYISLLLITRSQIGN